MNARTDHPGSDRQSDFAHRALSMLSNWAASAENDWYPVPGHPNLGCYGTGYNRWGVQTNQKYLSAMAVLGTLGPEYEIAQDTCTRALNRALAAFRFSLHTHVTGPGQCTDGTSWGRTWISCLGIERMMHAMPFLNRHLTDADRQAWRELLISEADAILDGPETFGRPAGVVAARWNHSGNNVPESNLWNGATVWRAATLFPDAPRAAAYREQAHLLLFNSISIAADAEDDRVVAGKPVRERFRGANFFPNFALDHHGYTNVGYQVVCLSNMAMLHFDHQALNLEIPESLYHHGKDLWQLVRRIVFGDGRLCRIGGDTRVRYTYCQEYLLPALTLAAQCFDEPHADRLIDGQLTWTATEQEYNGDGSFYRERLDHIRRISPYYITRLESDRACALGMLATHLHNCPNILTPAPDESSKYEQSVHGGWSEPEHGDVYHRCPTRIASFAWRAHGLAQGLCLPPADGHLADWMYNLGGRVTVAGDQGGRRLVDCRIDSFEGGFVTNGTFFEGVDVLLAEGWRGTDLIYTQLAVAALPDGHTMLGLHRSRTGACRVAVCAAKSLHLNIPNDLFNSFTRDLHSESGTQQLAQPVTEDVTTKLASPWANVDNRLGAVGIYGAETLRLSRRSQRRGGTYHSLYVDELCWGGFEGYPRMLDPDSIILDTGWAVLASADAAATQDFASHARSWELTPGNVRGVIVQGCDGVEYRFVANFGTEGLSIPLDSSWTGLGESPGGEQLPPGQARLYRKQ